MIQKAYIEKQIDGYSYKVRIPRYNKSDSSPSKTPTEQLYTAYACQLPDIDPYYANGDVVWVGFENDSTDKPVIMGKAFNGEDTQSHSEISMATESDTSSIPTNLNTLIEGIANNSSTTYPISDIEEKLSDIYQTIEVLTQAIETLKQCSGIGEK